MRLASRLPSLGSILLLVLGLAVLLSSRGDGDRSQGAREQRATALVTEVVDGDTAHMVVDGREQSVRYIGIDTPESAIPGEPPECFGKPAAALNRRLVAGERVTLVFGAERRDHYDRLLAYVHAGDRFVNAEIIRRGHARALAIAPNTDLAGRFARLQQEAANTGRGLWGAC